MKFTASSQELSAALQIVNMALKGRTTSPILECVLIEAKDDKIVLTGSDSSMQISYNVACDVHEPGASAIRGSLIEEVVRKFPAGDITFDVNEHDAFTVKSGRAKLKLAGSKADLFPIMPAVDAIRVVTLPGNDFCNMIASTETCIGVDDARPVLNGGCLDVVRGSVSMVGLDGFRMAVSKVMLSSVTDDMRVIIPSKTLSVLKKLLSSAGDELIDLKFGEKDFGLSFENADIRCILIEGQYVEYRQIVPKQFGVIVTLDARQLRNTVERAAMIARLGDNRLIRFAVRENSVTVYATNGTDEVTESIDADTQGADMEIAFNVKYMSDAVKMFNDGEIMLKMNNSISPCIVSAAEDDDNYFMLILPVRTNAAMPDNE